MFGTKVVAMAIGVIQTRKLIKICTPVQTYTCVFCLTKFVMFLSRKVDLFTYDLKYFKQF